MAIDIGGRKRKRRRLLSEINVTPFVDVMLVLLVIFMITSPMMNTGVDVDLPKVTKSDEINLQDVVIISITKDGGIYIKDRLITITGIKQYLNNITNKQNPIFIKADKNINYGFVMEIFSTVKQCGFSKISLITDVG